MKNAFYFTLKSLFVLKIFQFLSRLFGHVDKRHDKKNKVNIKVYDATAWLTSTCYAHITQYLKRLKAIRQFKYINLGNQLHYKKYNQKLHPDEYYDGK